MFNNLQNVQNTTARIISRIRITSSQTISHDELGWDALSVRKKEHKLILSYFYKIVYRNYHHNLFRTF